MGRAPATSAGATACSKMLPRRPRNMVVQHAASTAFRLLGQQQRRQEESTSSTISITSRCRGLGVT